MIYIYYKRGFRLNHKHKKQMVLLSGITFSRLSRAGMAFFFRLKEASVALQEGGSATLMSTGVADTDVMASELNLPLVANDTSVFSLHFFGYYMSYSTLRLKIAMLMKWKRKLKKSSKLRLKLFFLNFLFWLGSNNKEYQHVNEFFNYVVAKDRFDSNFILEGINAYNVANKIDHYFDYNYKLNIDLKWPDIKKNNK